MSLHRVEQERKDLATLWDAGGDRRPDALAPPAAFLTARPLADVPVDHHETSRLFGQIVRRVGLGGGVRKRKYASPCWPDRLARF